MIYSNYAFIHLDQQTLPFFEQKYIPADFTHPLFENIGLRTIISTQYSQYVLYGQTCTAKITNFFKQHIIVAIITTVTRLRSRILTKQPYAVVIEQCTLRSI